MNKKTIRDIDLKGKKVLVRCDFNVPLDEERKITDNRRIVGALPTIKYLLENNCKIILCSHLGRPKGEVNKKYSLDAVAEELSKLLDKKVMLAEDVTGESAKESTEAMVITGTIGDNNGFEWTYDAESKTLTVTGEDSGIEGNYNEGSQFNSICSDVVTVIFKDCKIKGSMECVLRKLAYLENVDFINVDTSDVTNMSFMFALCEKLKNADLSELDTYNVTTLIGLFYNCISLECVDIEGIDTSNVTTMQSLFYNCSNLENVDVSGFNTSKVTDLGYVFYGCNKLTNINVSNWSTSNVTSMYSLFANCENLKTLDVVAFSI